MKDYIRDVDAHWKADSSDFRNGKMVENLSNELNKHPDEKSLIIYGTDHSDFIIRGESGAAISFKNPETGRMQRLIDADDLPVKNTEPVAKEVA